MDSTEVPAETGSGASGPPALALVSAEIIVSDLHLGEGKTIEVKLKYRFKYRLIRFFRRALELFVGLFGFRIGRMSPLGTEEVPNPLEDFPYDREFAAFTRRVVAVYGHAGMFLLKLMGDCFDPLAVTCEGRRGGRRTEGVGANKMKKIISGHREFFDALEAFIALPNAHIDIFTGNHDSFLNWPAVRRILLRRITKGVPELVAKVRFVDYRAKYRQIEDEVLFDHGMNAEPHTSLDPAEPFITERFGHKLLRPELNEPLGNLMTEEVVNPSKMTNDNLSLLPDMDSWAEATTSGRFLWALGMGWLLLSFASRTAHKLAKVFATVLATRKKDPVDGYGEKLLREFAGTVRAVFLGHSHRPIRVTIPGIGTYINVGSPSRRRKLVWPEVAYHWKRFCWIEEGWRGFTHYLYSAKAPFGKRLTTFILYVVVMGLIIAFLQSSIGGAWTFALYVIKAFVGITFVFLALKGLTHFFLVKPEVVEYHLFTCGLKRRLSDGTLLADLMVYDPEQDTIREYV